MRSKNFFNFRKKKKNVNWNGATKRTKDKIPFDEFQKPIIFQDKE